MQILRDYMVKQGYNQSDLAKHLWVDRFAVSKWLSGKKKPRLETLEHISWRTGIKLEALVKSLNGSAAKRGTRNGRG